MSGLSTELLLLAQDIRVLENFGRPEYADHTTVHPLGLAMLVLCGLAILSLPRRFALLPFVAMLTLIPAAQRVVVLSLDFTFLRLLILIGLIRILAREEGKGFAWNKLDGLVVCWAAALFAVTVLRAGTQNLVYQCGFTLDALGGYFLARLLVRSWDDLNRLTLFVSLVAVPVAAFFLVESATQHNLFAVFGGVPETTMIREGRLRCQGPYSHPILAGCFWATMLPLCAARWWQGGATRALAVASVAAGLLIVVCCASSTPVFGVLGAALGAACFPLRRHLRAIRWTLLIVLVGLHLIMQAPVWHLVCRISAVGGSTGYHRYQLIDNFVKRVPEWAAVGTSSSAHWFWGGQDVTNQFVIQGVNGGLATLLLFVALLSVAFACAGRGVVLGEGNPPRLALAWALGVCLLTHCFCFIGVSYFGTNLALWYLHLGVIGGIAPVADTMAWRTTGGAWSAVGERRPAQLVVP